MDRLKIAVYLFGFAKPFSRYSESRIGSFVRESLSSRDSDDLSFPLEDAFESVWSWERIDSLDQLAEANHSLTLHLIQGLPGSRTQYSGNSPEVDHIFPRAELRRKGFNDQKVNDLANFWILAKGKNRNKSNRKPTDYFEDVSKTQLDRALIDPNLLQYKHYRKFIRERRAAMLRRLGRKTRIRDTMFPSD